ncbi:hypothetical protein BDV96DRAFT_694862 [Lophiotrema nucula]|uniref:Uncharacterized protein n=1 Tax=Lophiotrema nucula TaxID=690887 RepID=A0A6A5YEU8_9PLEO|nr:hypothetical protein BDV96DRAFT_694862 [Lophiotrema nucula]
MTRNSQNSSTIAFKPEGADWAPVLMLAPEIIRDLGICMSIACTRELARVKLNIDNTLLRTNDIPSNLVRVANGGQKVFRHGCLNLQKIAYMTEQLAAVDGLLDELAEAFADPDEQEMASSLVSQVREFLKKCNEHSNTSGKDFESLSDIIGDLHESITAAQDGVVEKIEDTQKELQDTTKSKAQEAAALRDHEHQLKDAETNFHRMINVHGVREDKLDTAVGFAVLSAEFGAIPIALASLAASALYGGLFAASGKALTVAEERLSEKRSAYGQTEIKLARLDAELESWQDAKNKLERTGRNLGATLELLSSLTGGITELMKLFTAMTSAMDIMLQEYTWTQQRIGMAQDAISKGDQPKRLTQKNVKRNLIKMKATAIRIHALAGTYALVIAEVVNPAWNMARKPALSIVGDEEVRGIIEDKTLEMEAYVDGARETCRVYAENAKRTMLEKLAGIDEGSLGLTG